MRFLLRLCCSVAPLLLAVGCAPSDDWQRTSGFVFGTQYNFTYRSHEDRTAPILERLARYDASLSVYNPKSLLSVLNEGDSVRPDADLLTVLREAQRYHELSAGAFDVTVEPLSRHWRFGPDAHLDTIPVYLYNSLLSSADSVGRYVGMELLSIDSLCVRKADQRMKLNCNALAEGRGIDMAAGVLDSLGVTDYMVEIGGEIRCRGVSPRGDKWRVAVERPTVGKGLDRSGRQCVIVLTDCGISTSGNYRQCYQVGNGRLLQHTIDPRTNAPVTHAMRSVTAVGPSTMLTDGLCTALMVAGPDSVLSITERFAKAGLKCEVMALYNDSIGREHVVETPGFQMLIEP